MIAAAIARLVSPLVAIPLILTALGGLYGWGYLKGFTNAKERSAIVWQRSLAEAQRIHDHRMQEALDEAEAIEATPTDDAELVGLCARDPACRDRKG